MTCNICDEFQRQRKKQKNTDSIQKNHYTETKNWTLWHLSQNKFNLCHPNLSSEGAENKTVSSIPSTRSKIQNHGWHETGQDHPPADFAQLTCHYCLYEKLKLFPFVHYNKLSQISFGKHVHLCIYLASLKKKMEMNIFIN